MGRERFPEHFQEGFRLCRRVSIAAQLPNDLLLPSDVLLALADMPFPHLDLGLNLLLFKFVRHCDLPKSGGMLVKVSMLIVDPDRSRIEEYRRKAWDARRRAAEVRDVFVRESWEYISQTYTETADRLERLSKG